MMQADELIRQLKFDDKDLVTAVAQDFATGEILMLAFMNAESIRRTIDAGQAVYWSRSRKRLWHKGEESGNVQNVKEILVDCDGDAIVLKVEQEGGAACHTGHRSCFYRKIDNDGLTEISPRIFDPEIVYKKGGGH